MVYQLILFEVPTEDLPENRRVVEVAYIPVAEAFTPAGKPTKAFLTMLQTFHTHSSKHGDWSALLQVRQ